MKYSCNDCSYSTDNKSNWNKHLKSNKHFLKEYEKTNLKSNISLDNNKITIKYHSEEKLKSYICKYCDFSTSYRPSLYRHQNNCYKDKLDKKDNEIKDLTIDHLKQVIEMLRDSLINGGNNSSTNGNSITEALYGKMKNNPPLMELDYDDFLSKHIHKDE